MNQQVVANPGQSDIRITRPSVTERVRMERSDNTCFPKCVPHSLLVGRINPKLLRLRGAVRDKNQLQSTPSVGGQKPAHYRRDAIGRVDTSGRATAS